MNTDKTLQECAVYLDEVAGILAMLSRKMPAANKALCNKASSSVYLSLEMVRTLQESLVTKEIEEEGDEE